MVSIFIDWQKGVGYFLVYTAVLIGIFLPVFIFIDLYKIIRQILKKEKIAGEQIILLLIYSTITLMAFMFGLQTSQIRALLVLDGILYCAILMVLLYKALKSKS